MQPHTCAPNVSFSSAVPPHRLQHRPASSMLLPGQTLQSILNLQRICVGLGFARSVACSIWDSEENGLLSPRMLHSPNSGQKPPHLQDMPELYSSVPVTKGRWMAEGKQQCHCSLKKHVQLPKVPHILRASIIRRSSEQSSQCARRETMSPLSCLKLYT